MATREATIAAHHGTEVALRHNRRDPEVVMAEDHIDLDRPHEVWYEKPLEQVYEEQFGDAIREYDAGQRRASRRIGGVQAYMEQIMQERAEVDEYNKRVKKENKAHENDPNWKKKRTKAAPALVYEEIAGVYKQSGPPLTEAEKRDMLKEYAEGWQQRNPKMALVGIYYHADEEGKDPHLHIDYVPVGEGYQRGPKRQNSLERACNAMGYKSEGIKSSAQIKWQSDERDALQRICEAHGIDVLHPQAGKNSQHKSTAQYKLEQKLKEAEERCAKWQQRASELEEQLKGPMPLLVYKGAKARKEQYEAEAEAAEARAREAEARREAAEKQAEEARQRAAEAEEQRKASEDARKREEAERKRLRDDMAAMGRMIQGKVNEAQQVKAYFEQVQKAPVTPTLKAMGDYMKGVKLKDGRTLYDKVASDSGALQQRAAKRHTDSLDDIIAEATRKASEQSQPGRSHDYEIGG